MSSAIEKLGAEIARLQAEVRTVEPAPPTIAERYEAAAAVLREAEQVYRTHGLNVSAGHPGEAAHLQRQALIGALMVATGGEKLLRAERQSIEQQSEGMTAVAKTARLDDLRRGILRAAARRENPTARRRR